MKTSFVTLLAVTAITLSPHVQAKPRPPEAPAAGGIPYYIELGSETTEEDAMQQWREISDHFSGQLSGLQFYPVTVVQASGKVVTRIQAGPIASKARAQDICARLFAENTPCFVIEGEKDLHAKAPEKPVEPKTSDSGLMPWHQGGNFDSGASVNEEVLASASDESAVAMAAEPEEATEEKAEEPEEKSSGGFLPWIFGSDDEYEDAKEEKPVAAEKPAGEAKVEVAEAIRVPLSDNEDAKPVIAQAQSVPHDPEPEAPAVMDDSGAGWLNVAAFYDEDNASGFWQDVRASAPKQAAGLRVRIARPLLSRGKRAVVLNVGPFPSAAEAMSFCNQGIKPLNDDLACRFERQEPMQTTQIRPPRYQHGNLYEARRRQLSGNRGNRGRSSMSSPRAEQKQYWAQVVSAKSQVKALQAWDNLRAAHPDLLEGARSSVSASLGRNSDYVVRVGPLGSREEAVDLCGKLQEKGTPCKVYSNM